MRTQYDSNKTTLKNIEKALDDLIKLHCSDGNWNYDSYMHGIANGLLLAKSLFDGKCPDYLKAPKVWIENLPNQVFKVSSE